MFDLGRLYIPTLLSFDPVTKTVSFNIPELYSKEYLEQVPYSLELNILGSDAIIYYYGEDDTYLSFQTSMKILLPPDPWNMRVLVPFRKKL